MALVDRDERARLVLPIYVWFQPLSGSRMLLWERPYVPEMPQNPATLRILDLNRLQPLTDVDEWTAQKPSPQRPHFSIGSDFIAAAEISPAYPRGRHDLVLPAAFDDVPEFFIVTGNPLLPQRPNGASACIYAVSPAERSVEVLPQDWFNEGDFDYGYQWITSAARDPITRRLVVAGFRLDALILDETGQRIEQRLPPISA